MSFFPACYNIQLHTTELNDGYDWGRLNLQSVTEQSSLDDFLATAELAGTEFVAGNKPFPVLTRYLYNTVPMCWSLKTSLFFFILEKLNIKFVPSEARAGLLTPEESKRIKKLHEENKQFLRIPRR